MSKQTRRNEKTPGLSPSASRKVREFSYSSSSEKAEGSMSMVGSSAILAASSAAFGFSLISAGMDSDHGISELRLAGSVFCNIDF